MLDIGCGSGRHTAAVYGHPHVTVVGSDMNIDDVIHARNRLRFHDHCGEHGGGTWLLSVSDITRLPFGDGAFDLVICSEVLEHIPDDHAAVREIIRVLKPKGTLAVSVPRYFPERLCWALSDTYHQTADGHVRIYRQQALIRLLESHGVSCRFHHFAHSLHVPYWWLKCLVGPTRMDVAAVNIYQRFLTWDILQKPFITRALERMFNPFFGKSLVVYCRKR